MAKALDPATRTAIEHDIQAGTKSRNQIARDHGVSTGSVTNIAKHLDSQGELTAPAFDRSATKRATQARAVDNDASRESLRALLLEDAHKLRRQLWAPCTIHNFGGKDNTYNSHDLDQPTFADQRQIMTTLGIAVDKVVKLDGGDTAEQEAASLIGALVTDIRSRRRPGVSGAAG